MKTRSINTIAYALCLIAPWSLLWLDSNLLFPYVTGKAWFFRSLIELAFALSLISRIFQARTGLPYAHQEQSSRALLYILLAFLSWTALTDLFGIDVYRSFWSNWERMGGLIDYLHWAMYLFCLITVLDKDRSRIMLINLVFVITLVCLVGFLDTEKRIISTLGNPIFLGNLVVFGLFISGFILAKQEGLHSRESRLMIWLLLIAMLIMGIALIKSASRGAMLGLLAGGLAVGLSISVEYARRHSRSAALLLLVGLIALGGLLSLQLDTLQEVFRQSDHFAFQRLGQISLADQTTADRLENWRIALDAAQSRPWSGWGQENYMIAFNEHYRAGVMDKAKLWFDRAHNAYLDTLLASGIPGLMLYCLMLVFPMWMVWRITLWTSREKYFVMGFFAAFMAKNIVGFDSFSSTLIWLSIIAVILVALQEPQVVGDEKRRDTSLGLTLISLVLLLTAFGSIYWLNLRPYQDNLHFAKLMKRPLASISAGLEKILNQPIANLRYAQNAKLVVFDTLLTGIPERDLTAIEAKNQKNVYLLAGILIEEALLQQPKNYRIKYNGGLLLARLGHYDLAIRLLEELTQTLPNRTAFWHTLAQTYAEHDLNESAIKARETAANLNPEWDP
jgi:O-antigen ligase